jgi:hypothetical protein
MGPHFHVIYGEYMAGIGIDSMRILNGRLPNRAQSMVFEWTAMHQGELRDNWERARRHEMLERIRPLE